MAVPGRAGGDMHFLDKAIGKEAVAGRISFSGHVLRSIPDNLKAEVIRDAEKASESEFPYLPLSLYREYSENGNRTNYQEPYFRKRKMLSILVLGECVEDKGRFINKIEEGIWSLLSEPVWTIPAHNTYIRDKEALNTPLLERPILDLFQCETGEILALTISLLKDKLDTTLIQDTEYILRLRILTPYTSDHFWWMGNDGALNNWAPWCTQNVLLSTLSISLNDKERNKVLRTAIGTLDEYIDSYPEDGGCDEGASYYHEAALALWGALYIISLSTGIDLKPLFSNPKIKAMAEYIEQVHVTDDIYLNFADCSPKAGRLTAREYLFGKAVGSRSLMHHAALDTAIEWKESDNDYNLFYKYLALASAEEILKETKKEFNTGKTSFTSFTRTGLSIYREKDITFAIKGGHNGESHNHNDAGSFILYKGKTPCLIDIGVETYTKTTFSKDRYTLRPMRSTYHNVVNFPPLEQHEGEEFRAVVLKMDENESIFDLTGVYEKGKGLERYIRKAFFDRESLRITITEDFKASQDGVLSLISTETPERQGKIISWSSFSAVFPESVTCEVESIAITDARLRVAWPETIYRTLITLPHAMTWYIDLKKGE